jgi:site-specific recombinase XerD
MPKNTFTISFYARDSKKDKNGLVHVEMSINVNQKRLFINLPFTVEPEKFNSKRRPKEYDDYLSLMRTRINQIMVDMIDHEEPITSERIREYVRTGGYKSFTMDDMFNGYLEILRKRLSQKVYRRYELLYELFKEKNNTSLEVTKLSEAMVEKFRDTLLERYDSSTAVGYMSKFKAFIRYAINNGHLKTNPAAYVKVKKEKKAIDFLTEEELKKLQDTQLDNQSLQNVLDLFLFEASSGISYADMQLLKKDDIKESNGIYYVSKQRQKTGTDFTAVILPFGVDILKKYDYNLRMISNQKINTYLKVIGNIVGIKKSLHSHLARHSYLTYLLNKGVSMEVCSKAAGHSSVKITQQFYASLHKDTVINEIAKIL